MAILIFLVFIMSEPWMTKPSVLFKMENLKIFIPTSEMTYVEKINAITRLVWYASILIYLMQGDINIFFVPIVGMICIYFLVIWGFDLEGLKEQFSQKKESCQLPTIHNPFMNAMITDKRNRTQACKYDPTIKKQITKEFDFNLYKDTDDVYGANNSQRQFYTMPSTTFPNKQNDFADWLYKTSPTCKEGVCW